MNETLDRFMRDDDKKVPRYIRAVRHGFDVRDTKSVRDVGLTTTDVVKIQKRHNALRVSNIREGIYDEGRYGCKECHAIKELDHFSSDFYSRTGRINKHRARTCNECLNKRLPEIIDVYNLNPDVRERRYELKTRQFHYKYLRAIAESRLSREETTQLFDFGHMSEKEERVDVNSLNSQAKRAMEPLKPRVITRAMRQKNEWDQLEIDHYVDLLRREYSFKVMADMPYAGGERRDSKDIRAELRALGYDVHDERRELRKNNKAACTKCHNIKTFNGFRLLRQEKSFDYKSGMCDACVEHRVNYIKNKYDFADDYRTLREEYKAGGAFKEKLRMVACREKMTQLELACMFRSSVCRVVKYSRSSFITAYSMYSELHKSKK